MKQNKILHLLVLTSNIVFLTLFAILTFNNRMAHDDFYSMYLVKNYGIIDSVVDQYLHWCTRYFSTLVSFFITYLYLQFKFTFILYQVALLGLITASLYLLIRNSLAFFRTSFYVKKSTTLNLSVFVVSAIFYSTFSIGETWFWLSSSSTYLLSVIVALFLAAFVISNKNRSAEYLLILLCSLYIGGANESLAIFLLLIQIAVFVYLKTRKRVNKSFQNKIIASFFGILLTFLLLYFGPGNGVREGFFSPIGIFDSFLLNLKTSGMIVLQRLPQLALFLFLFAVPAYITGQLSSRTISMKVFLKKLWVSTLIIGLMIFLFQWPVTYKTQDIAADRTLFPLTIILLLYGFFLSYNFSKTRLIPENVSRVIIASSIIVVVVFSGYQLFNQFKITSAYAKAYDNRMLVLQKHHGNKTLTVEPLPASGYLFSAEISSDTAHFNNQHLKQGLDLPVDIKIGADSVKPGTK